MKNNISRGTSSFYSVARCQLKNSRDSTLFDRIDLWCTVARFLDLFVSYLLNKMFSTLLMTYLFATSLKDSSGSSLEKSSSSMMQSSRCYTKPSSPIPLAFGIYLYCRVGVERMSPVVQHFACNILYYA